MWMWSRVGTPTARSAALGLEEGILRSTPHQSPSCRACFRGAGRRTAWGQADDLPAIHLARFPSPQTKRTPSLHLMQPLLRIRLIDVRQGEPVTGRDVDDFEVPDQIEASYPAGVGQMSGGITAVAMP